MRERELHDTKILYCKCNQQNVLFLRKKQKNGERSDEQKVEGNIG